MGRAGYHDAGTGARLKAEKGCCSASGIAVASAPEAGLSLEKALLASEAGREDVLQARDDWKKLRQPLMRQQTHRLVLLDETGTTTKMTRLRGRSRRGTR